MEIERDLVTTPVERAGGGLITKDGSHSFHRDLRVSY